MVDHFGSIALQQHASLAFPFITFYQPIQLIMPIRGLMQHSNPLENTTPNISSTWTIKEEVMCGLNLTTEHTKRTVN